MGMIANIICKTVGAAGMSAVIYDAYSVGRHHAVSGAQEENADTFESIVAAKRTTSTESSTSGAIQEKVSNLRMNNPIIPIYGKVKGFTRGVLTSLGDDIVPVIFASLALAAKNGWAKLGAWGVAGCGLYTIVKEGFGIGKTAPVDD